MWIIRVDLKCDETGCPERMKCGRTASDFRGRSINLNASYQHFFFIYFSFGNSVHVFEYWFQIWFHLKGEKEKKNIAMIEQELLQLLESAIERGVRRGWNIRKPSQTPGLLISIQKLTKRFKNGFLHLQLEPINTWHSWSCFWTSPI